MSVIRFKKVDQLTSREERTERKDFSTLIASMISMVDAIGLQQAKRKRDDEASSSGSSGASSSSTTTRTPPRRPKPYVSRGIITSSTITSLLYKYMTGKEFCWKLEDYFKKRKPFFKNITKMFFMPGGNIFEDQVLDNIDSYLRMEDREAVQINRQYQEGGYPDIYEQDALNRMNYSNFQYISRQNGFTNQESDDLKLWGRTVRCRADGYNHSHVIEVKVPFGGLYKVYGSGTEEYEEDGIKKKRYNEEKEIFTVPPHYMCQLLIEMNCFKRRKAYFGQYYSYENWFSLVDMLVDQHKSTMRGVSFRRGTVLYKPILDLSTPVNTIMKRIIKIFTAPADTPKQKAKNRERATTNWHTFLNQNCGVPLVPDKLTATETDDWIERQWRPLLKNIMKYTTPANLQEFSIMQLRNGQTSVFRFTPFMIDKIMQELTVGPGDDIQRGVVQPDGMVLWDGEATSKPFQGKEEYLNGIKKMLKTVIQRVSRKKKEIWDAFEHALVREDVLNLPAYEEARRKEEAYDEFVLLEVDLSNDNDWEEAMGKLKGFLKDCESITQGILNCKGGKRGEPKMMGKNGVRDVFIDYLKSIPATLLDRRKIQI
jgi:hypothetical protein